MAKRAARRGLTPRRRKMVLELLAETGSFGKTAKGLGVSIHTLAYWRQKHPDFAQEVSDALDAFDDSVASRTAVEAGVEHLERYLAGTEELNANVFRWMLPAKFRVSSSAVEHSGELTLSKEREDAAAELLKQP